MGGYYTDDFEELQDLFNGGPDDDDFERMMEYEYNEYADLTQDEEDEARATDELDEAFGEALEERSPPDEDIPEHVEVRTPHEDKAEYADYIRQLISRGPR